MPSYDDRHVEKQGYLTEPDHNKLCQALLSKLSNIRIHSIRQLLVWRQFSHEEHRELAKALRDPSPAGGDPSAAFDVKILPLSLKASIKLQYFPEFLLELDLIGDAAPLGLLFGGQQSGENAMYVLNTSMYRTLLNAQFQLEQQLRAAYRTTTLYKDIASDMELEFDWAAPAKVVLSPNDELELTVSFLLMP